MSEVLDAEASSHSGTQQRLRIAVFVISLPDAEKRRRVITEYLSRVNLPWSFFEGFRYTPKGPVPDQVKILDELSTGQVGCFLSHRALWKEIGNSELDYAIVLEDDTVLIPSLDFFALFSLFKALGLGYIRLTTHQIIKAKTLVRLGDPFGLVCRVVLPKYGLGTGGYALTPAIARQLYASANPIDDPIDLWLERYSNHDVAIYNLFPSPAIEIRTQSNIQLPPRKNDGIVGYVKRKVTQSLLDARDQRKLSKLDDALRERADHLYPGMGVWPRSELRRYTRRLLRLPG